MSRTHCSPSQVEIKVTGTRQETNQSMLPFKLSELFIVHNGATRMKVAAMLGRKWGRKGPRTSLSCTLHKHLMLLLESIAVGKGIGVDN